MAPAEQRQHVADDAAVDGSSWPQRWTGSLRQRRVKLCVADSEAAFTLKPATPAPSSCNQPRKRKRALRVEKVPVKPPPEAAAARAGPALKVHPLYKDSDRPYCSSHQMSQMHWITADQARLAEMLAASCDGFPPGSRLWAKLRGSCAWPAVMWSVSLCRRLDVADLAAEFRSGQVLVRCYGEHSSMWVSPEALMPWRPAPDPEIDPRVARMHAWAKINGKALLVEATLVDMEDSEAEPAAELARMQRLAATYARLPLGTALHTCGVCTEVGAALQCRSCDRAFHTLCLAEPVLAVADLVLGSQWLCPSCSCLNQVQQFVAVNPAEGVCSQRMGLTPDWIIQAAAYDVFQLQRPTPSRPYIKGLLDPCTNSKMAPNIAAEKLYDRKDNGLRLSNSWKGYHVLLNPEFSQQILWRFVNRAIDEVENDRVPACLLIVRNSTDTKYYQRLQPYPRVLLRRESCRFKDYDDLPIAWGVVIFCIAKHDVRSLYPRFYSAFASAGETSMPVDATLLRSNAFYELLTRLRLHAAEHDVDHWVQCSACSKWRILGYDAMRSIDAAADWTCSQLGEPGCAMLQSKREARGTRYVALGIEPDAALFDFGNDATATLAMPTTMPGAAKALLLDVQQQTEQPQQAAAGCNNAPVTPASPVCYSPPTMAPGRWGVVHAAAEAEVPHRFKAEPALPREY